jgi:hypothetical protein
MYLLYMVVKIVALLHRFTGHSQKKNRSGKHKLDRNARGLPIQPTLARILMNKEL